MIYINHDIYNDRPETSFTLLFYMNDCFVLTFVFFLVPLGAYQTISFGEDQFEIH